MNLPALPGHPHIARHGDALQVEGQSLAALAAEHGTPLFVYSRQWMLDALAAYQRGFEGRNALICYAMKANSSLGVLRVFAEAGCGFDIVSGGELARVMAAGADPAKVIFSGVGKTRAEMHQALAAGIACFNVESEAELEVLNAVALEEGHRAAVSIRINPNVDPKTHPYISTGLKGNKFGVAHDRALGAYRHAASLPGLRVLGIDCHIGSQITEASPYLDALERVLDLVEAIESAGIPLHHLDFGGGLGIDYNHDTPPAADVLWKQLLARLDARGFGDRKLVVEPGRSLVGNAGVCVTEVLYTKPGEDKNFCIVDAAMNDLPRPAMYQAFHQIVPVAAPQAGAATTTYDVVGPVCESGDFMAHDRSIPTVAAGDLIAIASAGAYGAVQSGTYNTRALVPEVLVNGDAFFTVRPRQTVEQLIALDRLPPWLEG